MSRLFDSVDLALTPLTPIHIGCGEDFEPTNYVIEDGVLHYFDAASARLSPEDRRALAQAIGGEGTQALLRLQRYFFERRDTMIAATKHLVDVAPGVAEEYRQRIGKVAQKENSGRKIINVLEIERTAHHPHDGTAYIPGSSLKGAMRTAWLDHLNRGRPRRDDEKALALEQRLLGGAFHTDPFRMVKVADTTGKAITRVVFSTNHKKRPVFKDGRELTGRGPAVRREAIAPGQYRALRSELRFDGLQGPAPSDATPARDKRILRFDVLAQACNSFYLQRLTAELGILENRRFVSDDWLRWVRRLIDELSGAFQAGQVMLLRVGRHSGAESVTLEGVRSIRIMGGRGGPTDAAQSTTLWLAAERQDARSDMQPFGFVLVEPAGAPQCSTLKQWCEQQPPPDLGRARARIEAVRNRLRAEALAAEQREAEQRATEEAKRKAAEDQAARWEAMTEQGRRVEQLRQRLEAHIGRKQPVSGILYAETQKLIKAALETEWGAEDRRTLADLIAGAGFAKIDFQSRTNEIKLAIKKLRGEA